MKRRLRVLVPGPLLAACCVREATDRKQEYGNGSETITARFLLHGYPVGAVVCFNRLPILGTMCKQEEVSLNELL